MRRHGSRSFLSKSIVGRLARSRALNASSILPGEPIAGRRSLWRWRSHDAADTEVVVPVVMAGYAGPNFWKRHRRLLAVMLAIFAFFYGAAFALFTTFIVLQLAIPLVIMILLMIWLLPATDKVPVGTLNKLMFTFMIVTICWPNYLAIALPGMPWITMNRLVTVPLAIVMLITLSGSRAFRRETKAIIDSTPVLWKLVCAFALITFISVFVSPNPAESFSKFVVAQLSWTLIFFTAAIVFVRPGNAIRLSYTLWFTSIIVIVIGYMEWRHSALPWAGHIPSFLKVDDPSVQNMLAGTARSATGVYRVKSVSTSPLGLGEFLAFVTPFIVCIALNARKRLVCLAAWATIPPLFGILISTDSRLGMIGFFMTGLLYLLVWGVMRWRDRPEQMVGRIVVLTYPALAAAFFALSLVWTRLHNMVWGGGATIPSTEARKAQWAEGIPKLLSAPWGHGIGQGGRTLGHYGGGGILTIDSYYLTVLLEYGVIGFVVYFGMFVVALYFGGRALLKSSDPETRLLIPLLIAIANFIVIKSVFSQDANHSIIFCLLGVVVALIYRIQGTAGNTRRVRDQLANVRMALPGRRPVIVLGR